MSQKQRRGRSRKHIARAGTAVVCAVFVALGTVIMNATSSYGQASEDPAQDSAQSPSGDDFSISLPAEPVVIRPGEAHTTSLRIVNRAATTTRFRITGVVIQPLDEGEVEIAEGSDAWSESVKAPQAVEVSASNFVDVPISFRAPGDASVDIHLVGFLVRPIHPDGPDGVEVRTEAVTFLPVEIPGKSNRAVAIENYKLPRFVFSQTLRGNFGVRNIGESGVRFRGQVFLDSGLSDRNFGITQAGDPSSRLLLPVDRFRTLDYEWTAGLLPAVVDPTIEVNFEDGESGLKAVRQSVPVTIVVPPATSIGLLVIFGMVLVGLIFRFFRKIKSRRTAIPS